MNAIFGKLTNEGLEQAEDRVGGFQPLDSGAYVGKITTAYAGQSTSGASNVTLTIDAGGQELRQTIYVTNRKGENFFLNKQDNTKKVPLPGFTTVDHICLIATGSGLSEQPMEEKTVKVYDYDAGREVPKAVQMLVDLVGKEVEFGVLRILENKSKKNDSTNKYEDIADTREINEIDKVFDPGSGMTVVEAMNEQTEAAFRQSWLDRNEGETRDKRTITDKNGGGNAGRPGGAPAAGASGGEKKKSLFGG